jgi:spore maturation protein CgeB
VKILFVDTYYEAFLKELPTIFPKIDQWSYTQALESTIGYGFGTAAALSDACNRQGHEAHVLVPNSNLLQSKWCSENLVKLPNSWFLKWSPHINRVPYLQIVTRNQGPGSLLELQAKESNPDVIYIQDINYYPPSAILRLRDLGFKVVGEIASALPPDSFLYSYNAIVSALPSIVSYCDHKGIPAYNLALAFDDKNLYLSRDSQRDIDAIFIGSSGKSWQTLDLLQEVAKQVENLRIYGPISDKSIKKAGLSEFFYGEAWGKEMFSLLGRSRISLNRHGKIAGDFSVNMRMFEATGMGCMLLTDTKPYTSHLFEPGQEIVMYHDFKDAGRLAKLYLSDQESLNKIAERGKIRTLNDHTYSKRASELIVYLSCLLD